jgi:hypothetical protein
MPSPRIIEARKVWAAATELTRRLAQLDYDGFCQLARASRLSALDIERSIQQYGRSVCQLPQCALNGIKWAPISGSEPQKWHVVVPLWTKQEGRSDLTLELTLVDSPKEFYEIEIDDLHVL